MDDALMMGIFHRHGDRRHVFRGLGRSQQAFAGAPGQVGSVHKFHGKERLALVLAHLEDGDDVRMLQARSHFGFAPETLLEGGVGASAGQKELQRDDPIEAALARAEDRAHSAVRYHAQNLVAADVGSFPAGNWNVLQIRGSAS